MFNCKKLFKLQIRPPEPNRVDYYIPGYVNISQPKLRSEKFDDDDDDNNNNIIIITLLSITQGPTQTLLSLHNRSDC